MKRLFLHICLLFCAEAIMAQNTITGKVVNAQGEPLPFVNIILLSVQDSTFVKGSVSDEQGNFTISSDKNDGILKVSSIGYQTLYKQLNGAHLETIQLKDESTSLGEVVVKGHLPQYKMTGEGLLTNVEGTILSKAGTADDVLKHVPSIIKKNDNYEVFGKGTPIIYVNGKKVQDLNELDNIKSTDIKSVEVIQNPGASYDASVKAVVKIRTSKPKGEGFAFDTRSVYWYNKASNTIQQINMNYRHNGLNVFATYKLTNSAWLQDATFEQTVYVDTLWKQKNTDWEHHRKEYHRLIGGFSYDFNTNHSIGLKYQLRAPGYVRGTGTVESLVTADGNFYDETTTTEKDVNRDEPQHQINAYYNGVFGKTTVDLNTDVFYNKELAYSETAEVSKEHDSRVINSKNKVSNLMVASKLVFDTPILGGSLTYGAEYINTHRKDDYEVNRTDILANSYSKLEEQTASPFLQYSHPTPIGNLSVGVRYEYVKFKYYNDGIYQPDQSRSFKNFFPSFSYDGKIGKVAFQLSYSAKTVRPSYSQLSNNMTYMNRFTRLTGNPQLGNTTNHIIGLEGVWKCFQLSANYTDSRNAIIYWGEQMEENPAITLTSFKNEKSIKSMNLFVSAAPKIGFWSPQISFGIQKQWFTLHTSIDTYKLNLPMYLGTFNNGFSLPWGLVFNVDYSYLSKGDNTNFYIPKECHELNIGMSKSFLHDALTIEVKGNDLFYQDWDTGKLYNDKMQLVQYARRGSRDVTFTLRYKFNTTRSKYKGTGAGNDEINRL